MHVEKFNEGDRTFAAKPRQITVTAGEQRADDKGGLASINRRAEPYIVLTKAVRFHLWDEGGHEFIDFHASFWANFLGHGDTVQSAVEVAATQSCRSSYVSGPTTMKENWPSCFFVACPAQLKCNSSTQVQKPRPRRSASLAWTERDHAILVQGEYSGNQNVVAVNLMSRMEKLGSKQVIGDECPLVPIGMCQ